MEIIITWLGSPPEGYEALGYIIYCSFVFAIIAEVVDLIKLTVKQSLRIGR